MLARTAIFVGLAFLPLVAFLTLYAGASDVIRAYPSPERHRGVHEIEIAGLREKVWPDAPRDRGDFDGDGIDDVLTGEYFHMEPLLRRTTSGMVRIRSGASGELLLAHAVPTPFNRGVWYGDLDGNGTDDVVVNDGERLIAFGFTGRR